MISKFELAGALGEQMATLQEAADAEAAELAAVVDLPQPEPEETTFGTLAEPDELEGEVQAEVGHEPWPEGDDAVEDDEPSPVLGRLEEALAPMRRDEGDAGGNGPESRGRLADRGVVRRLRRAEAVERTSWRSLHPSARGSTT